MIVLAGVPSESLSGLHVVFNWQCFEDLNFHGMILLNI